MEEEDKEMHAFSAVDEWKIDASNTDKFSFGFRERKEWLVAAVAAVWGTSSLVKFRIQTPTLSGWSRSCRFHSPRWSRSRRCTRSDSWWSPPATAPAPSPMTFARRWTTAVDSDPCANSESSSRRALVDSSMGFQASRRSARRGELRDPRASDRAWFL